MQANERRNANIDAKRTGKCQSTWAPLGSNHSLNK